MVIRHRSVVCTRKMLRAFLKTRRAVQLLHACVIKFKVSGTVYIALRIYCCNTIQDNIDIHIATFIAFKVVSI